MNVLNIVSIFVLGGFNSVLIRIKLKNFFDKTPAPYFCNTDNQKANDVSKMKNSSSTLQQAVGSVEHLTQDQATQTTWETPRPSKSSGGSSDFLKNEVLRIHFDFTLPPQNYVTIIINHNCKAVWGWAGNTLRFRNPFEMENTDHGYFSVVQQFNTAF